MRNNNSCIILKFSCAIHVYQIQSPPDDYSFMRFFFSFLKNVDGHNQGVKEGGISGIWNLLQYENISYKTNSTSSRFLLNMETFLKLESTTSTNFLFHL